MVVVFDNNVLCLLLHPGADVPNDPSTGKPIDRPKERMALLEEEIRKAGARIAIPAPVLSEFLTFASIEYLTVIQRSPHFDVSPFDERAAIESAIALRKDLDEGRGKTLGLGSPWQKIKVDRQIVAIAKTLPADTIYTTDSDIIALAERVGLNAVHVADLPLPPSKTPLLDAAAATEPDASTEPEPPSAQSAAAEQAITPQPAPARRAIHLDGPELPPPDSSPAVPPKPPSA
jgi:hypothetical protein